MTVNYVHQEPPAPADRIGALETRLGQSLPGTYRAYLQETDGGRLDNNTEAVKSIFGVAETLPDRVNMFAKLDLYKDRVPEWLLPVARDEYGNLLCVSMRDSDAGTVWFWDHEEEASEGDPPAEDNLTLKAPSWPEFLSSLVPISNDDQ